MEIKIIKIDGEFVIVALESGSRKVCPTEIFPKDAKEEDTVCIYIKK